MKFYLPAILFKKGVKKLFRNTIIFNGMHVLAFNVILSKRDHSKVTRVVCTLLFFIIYNKKRYSIVINELNSSGFKIFKKNMSTCSDINFR